MEKGIPGSYFTPCTKLVPPGSQRAHLKSLPNSRGRNCTGGTKKAQTTKCIAEKLELTQIKNGCASEDTTNRMVGKPKPKAEKIFASQMFDKELTSQSSEDLLEISNKSLPYMLG